MEGASPADHGLGDDFRDEYKAAMKGTFFYAGFGVLLLCVLVSRLPFLDAGYGVNVDAWRVARTARSIAESGRYEVSRFPGFPVQELICAAIWKVHGGPVALNGASALFSVLCVALFILVMREAGGRDSMAAGAALAFCPLFYINSVSSKDYIWALTFLLGSVLLAGRRRVLAAGICLGIAAGCRLTTAAMGLPLALILIHTVPEREVWKKLAVFAMSAALTWLACFSPVLWRYGLGFLTFYNSHDRPGWEIILERGIPEVWGWMGTIGIGIALAGVLLRIWRPGLRASIAPPCPGNRMRAWAFFALIGIATFLSLPDQAGYIMPALPFILLLLAALSYRPLFLFFCGLTVLSSFADLNEGALGKGWIFRDQAARKSTIENIQNFLSFVRTMPGHNVIAVGSWDPLVAMLAAPGSLGQSGCVGIMTEGELEAFQKEGATIWYIPEIRAYNYRVYGIDLARYGAKNIRALYDAEMARRSGNAAAAGGGVERPPSPSP